MTRLAGTILTEAQGQVVYPAWFVYLDVLSNPLYLNSSDQDYTVGGNTYNHGVFVINTIEERDDTTAPEMHVTLPLDNTDPVVAALLADRSNYSWRPLTITLYLIDKETYKLIGPTPLLVWTGFMTAVGTKQDKGQGVITITAQNWVSMLDRVVGPKFTVNDQQNRAGFADSIFNHVARLDGREIIWMGSAGAGDSGGVLGGGGGPKHRGKKVK